MKIEYLLDFDGTLTDLSGGETVNSDFFKSCKIDKNMRYGEKNLLKPESSTNEAIGLLDIFKKAFHPENPNKPSNKLRVTPEAVNFLKEMTNADKNDVGVTIVSRNYADYIRAMLRFELSYAGLDNREIDRRLNKIKILELATDKFASKQDYVKNHLSNTYKTNSPEVIHVLDDNPDEAESMYRGAMQFASFNPQQRVNVKKNVRNDNFSWENFKNYANTIVNKTENSSTISNQQQNKKYSVESHPAYHGTIDTIEAIERLRAGNKDAFLIRYSLAKNKYYITQLLPNGKPDNIELSPSYIEQLNYNLDDLKSKLDIKGHPLTANLTQINLKMETENTIELDEIVKDSIKIEDKITFKNITREEAEKQLINKEVGTFIIRPASSGKPYIAASMKMPSGAVYNYLYKYDKGEIYFCEETGKKILCASIENDLTHKLIKATKSEVNNNITIDNTNDKLANAGSVSNKNEIELSKSSILSKVDLTTYLKDNNVFSNGLFNFNYIWQDLKYRKNEEVFDINEISYLNSFLHAHPEITGLNLTGMGIGDEAIKEIAKNKTLLTLEVKGNNISSEGAKALANNDNITALILDGNKIGDEGAEALLKNSRLSSLSIERCHLSNVRWPDVLSNNKSLEELNLSSNNIGDDTARIISKNQHLKSLQLRSNKIDKGVMALLEMKSLNDLNLSINPLSSNSITAIESNFTISNITTDFYYAYHPQTRLVKFMNALGYKNIINGCCHGISFMAMQALYIKDGMLNFNTRLNEIDAIVSSLQKEILRELSIEKRKELEIEALEGSLKKEFDNRLSEKINTRLVEIQQTDRFKKADLLAFCDGAYLHQKTGSLSYLFTNTPESSFSQANRFIPLASANELEGSIEPIKQITGVYSLKELELFFMEMQQSLSSQTLSKPVTMILSGPDHTIMVAYNPALKNWIFMDPNDMPCEKMGDNHKLAKRVIKSLAKKRQTTVLSAKMFAHSSEKEIIRNQITKWLEKENIQAINKITPEKLAFSQPYKEEVLQSFTWQRMAKRENDSEMLNKLRTQTSFFKRHPRLSAVAITLGAVSLISAAIAVSAFSFGIVPLAVGAFAIGFAPGLMLLSGFLTIVARKLDKVSNNTVDVFNMPDKKGLMDKVKEKIHTTTTIFDKLSIGQKSQLSQQNKMMFSSSESESIKTETKNHRPWIDKCLKSNLVRNEAVHLLMEKEQGTFILRYASEKGYLALSIKGQGEVIHLKYRKEELAQYNDINAFYQSIRNTNQKLPQLNLIEYEENKNHFQFKR